MLDFETLDRALENAVGVSPEALLGAASPSWSNRFFLARERLADLLEAPAAGSTDQLERERLADFFGCAYGEHGFLARAGALQTLVRGLDRLATTPPGVLSQPGRLESLRRELGVLSMLGRHRLSRPLRDDDRPLLGQLEALEQAVGDFHGFASEAQLGARSLDVARRASSLYGGGELTGLISEMREGLSAAGAISFVLARLADWSFSRDASGGLDALCRKQFEGLRLSLWKVAEEKLSRRARPPTLREIQSLDQGLEALGAALGNPRFSAEARVQVIAALLALVVTSLAASASRLALDRLDGTLLLIAQGLSEGRR